MIVILNPFDKLRAPSLLRGLSSRCFLMAQLNSALGTTRSTLFGEYASSHYNLHCGLLECFRMTSKPCVCAH
jgi:hypothetical protein